MYIHQIPEWPRFGWREGSLAQPLAGVRYRQGRMTGHMEALGFEFRKEAVLNERGRSTSYALSAEACASQVLRR